MSLDSTPNAYTCTPASLQAANPCLNCLSDKELLGVLVGILIQANDTTVKAALQKSACFTCLTRKQMKQGLVTIMNEGLGGATTLSKAVAMLSSLRNVDETRLNATALYLLCQLRITIPPAVPPPPPVT